MANWSALAGFAGLASALESIQDRRAREAALQQKLTEGQGEWTPATSSAGGWGVLDALLGHNRQGEVGFGSQRYQFQPYAPVTEEQARAWGMTYPETRQLPGADIPSVNLAPPGQVPGFGPQAAALARKTPEMTFKAADETAFPFTPVTAPPRTVTEDKPMPGIVGMRLGPKEKLALFQEQLKERRELARLAREQELLKDFNVGGFRVGTGTTGTTPLPDETTGTSTPTSTPTSTGTQAAPAPAVQGAIPGTEKTSPQFMAKAQKISSDLGMRLDDFLRVMSYETNGSFSPAQKNIGGRSSATGLIQFLSKTARGLGTTTEALAAMSPEQQLDYVAKYLAPYKGRIGNLQDLYMAVLSPASIGKSGSAVVFSQDKNPAEYTANAPLDVEKKGYITVSDATNALMRRTGGTVQAPAMAQGQVPAATDPATQTYVAQFQRGSEADARQTIAATEAKANPKNPTDQVTITAMKRAFDTVFPRGQAQVPAQQPDTSMLVAGNAAPAPPGAPASQPAPGTAAAPAPEQAGAGSPLTPGQAPFQLSLEGRRQILANNKAIERNNQEIQTLDQKQRTANYLAATRKNPQLGAMAVQIGQRIADLSRDNQSLRDMSERTLQDESREWRTRQDVLAKEKREREEKRQERLRRPGEITAEKTAERVAEEAYYDTQPIGEHPRVKAEEYFDKKTGDPIDDSMLTRQWRAQNKVGNLARLADVDQRKQLTTLKMLEPLLQQYTSLVQYAYGTDDKGKPGPLAQFSRSPNATVSAMMSQLAQTDPVLQAKRRALEGQLQTVVRALGSRGDLNAQELAAAQSLIVNMDASLGLGLNLGVGPMFGTSGFGVGGSVGIKPTISIPDTPAVGVQLGNELIDLVNARIGSLLRNKAYKGTLPITLPTGPLHKPPSTKSTPPTLVPWPSSR